MPPPGGGGCESANAKFAIVIAGAPTGGTWSITFTTPGGTATVSSLSWSITNSTLQSSLEGAANIGSGNVVVTGGAAPNATLYIEFIGTLANTHIDPPILSWASLTGGTGRKIDGYPVQMGRA